MGSFKLVGNLTPKYFIMNRLYQAIVFISILSCNSNLKYTETEKGQAKQFIESLNLDMQSIKISNSENDSTKIDAENISRILFFKTHALLKAEEIPNSVLLKMNKDLPENYSKYKKGLALRIDNLKNGNLKAEMEGSRLINEWADWYDVNKGNIKIPK